MAALKPLFLAAVAAAGLCAGCATMGHDLDLSRLDQLVAGTSTIEDARRLFGEPSAEAVGPQGGHVYVWQYGHANTLSGQSQGKSVTLVFANTGKLLTKTRAVSGIKTD